MRPSLLDTLAESFGIEDAYRDAQKKIQRTEPETKRLLLAAMGIDASDDARIAAILNKLERAGWELALQPVYVVNAEAGPIAIDLTLPSKAREVQWTLSLEDGGEKRGYAEIAALVLVGKHEFDGERLERRKLTLGDDIPWGYHRLKINGVSAETLLIVAPGRCWAPTCMSEGKRLWGVSAQLYTLRSEGNWGIGDFGDLVPLVHGLRARGADIVGLNPLHAMFLDNPEHASPYSPASRLFLNVLYIDVKALREFADCAEAHELVASVDFQERLDKCRSSALVDYTRAAELKLEVLRVLFKHWSLPANPNRDSFEAFRQERGEALERSCVFHCLRQEFGSQDLALRDWRYWPEAYRQPESAAVAAFAIEHREEVTFMAWMEWLADSQLRSAADAASGMEIGLYRDMAVGADRMGAEAWSNQKAFVSGVHIGAPPDPYTSAGQDWGLPPFNPRALKEEGYRVFVELIRANMRYAGALRIDHVMALQHLYWVPESRSPKQGAYVRYPLDDLVGILALESQRNRCLVVGEDLGTVPDGFRERMAEANILSYRVLFFEQNSKTGAFRKPGVYPERSMAVASNHDLPTIRAWWEGSDISLREQLSLFPDPESAADQRKQRIRDRRQLLRALRQEGLLGDAAPCNAGELMLLVHAYLARTGSFLAMAQVDDIAGEIDPVNIPASLDYPNWRRRLSVTLGQLFEETAMYELAAMFVRERGAPEIRSESAAG
ncbi:MAG: 4-alpha-glucanotransferase [Candidatus Acidiferrales bacterium]